MEQIRRFKSVEEAPARKVEENVAILVNFEDPVVIRKTDKIVALPHQKEPFKLPEIPIEEIRGPANADQLDADLARKRAKIKEVGCI